MSNVYGCYFQESTFKVFCHLVTKRFYLSEKQVLQCWSIKAAKNILLHFATFKYLIRVLLDLMDVVLYVN